MNAISKHARADRLRRLAREEREQCRTLGKLAQEFKDDHIAGGSYSELAEEAALKARACELYAALVAVGGVT